MESRYCGQNKRIFSYPVLKCLDSMLVLGLMNYVYEYQTNRHLPYLEGEREISAYTSWGIIYGKTEYGKLLIIGDCIKCNKLITFSGRLLL